MFILDALQQAIQGLTLPKILLLIFVGSGLLALVLYFKFFRSSQPATIAKTSFQIIISRLKIFIIVLAVGVVGITLLRQVVPFVDTFLTLQVEPRLFWLRDTAMQYYQLVASAIGVTMTTLFAYIKQGQKTTENITSAVGDLETRASTTITRLKDTMNTRIDSTVNTAVSPLNSQIAQITERINGIEQSFQEQLDVKTSIIDDLQGKLDAASDTAKTQAEKLDEVLQT